MALAFIMQRHIVFLGLKLLQDAHFFKQSTPLFVSQTGIMQPWPKKIGSAPHQCCTLGSNRQMKSAMQASSVCVTSMTS